MDQKQDIREKAELRSSLPNQMKGRLVVFCGIPGSGKTTIAKLVVNFFEDSILIETDEVRKMLAHPHFSPGESRFVYNASFALAREALKVGYFVLLDGTFLKEEYRREARRVLSGYYERSYVVWVSCRLETALERNSGRREVVPPDKVKAMFEMFENPRVAIRVDSSQMSPESAAWRIVTALTG